jgi:hypothetical protein
MQKKALSPVIMLLLFLGGCGESQNAVSTRTSNRDNMTKIALGMTKVDVMAVMGNKTIYIKNRIGRTVGTVSNPSKTEAWQTKEHTYESLYYYTHSEQAQYPFKDFRVLDRELTPIVFQDGKVIGWGSEFLARMSNQ